MSTHTTRFAFAFDDPHSDSGSPSPLGLGLASFPRASSLGRNLGLELPRPSTSMYSQDIDVFELNAVDGHARSNAQDRKIGTYDAKREGGWETDAFGNAVYQPYGKIDEIPDDVDAEDYLAQHGDELWFEEGSELDEGIPPPPPPVPRTIPLLPLELVDNLPLHSYSETPPRLSTPASSGLYPHSRPSLSRNPTPAPALPLRSSSSASGTHEQLCTSLSNASADVLSLRSKLALQRKPDSAALALCEQIVLALNAVRGALERRLNSSSRQQTTGMRHDARLLSLKRTLQKLHTLSALRFDYGTRDLRAHQLTRVRSILEQHRSKFYDLARKFNATFDRLHIRHMYDEMQRQATKMNMKTKRKMTLYHDNNHTTHNTICNNTDDV
uniref:Uncharacterized protein n=1 Tax=Mycena chlorophos TaxID=658473 RepID=A0ABQ0M4T0_MYCCL|nr:predicted protein [Mycena chlorophos]